MHEAHYLLDILILLSAAVLVVSIFRHLNFSPVLGYIVAGAAIGPHGLKIIGDVENTRALAEFGVVFMLFMIGLELTWERLKSMRRHVFGFGSLQVVLTGIVLGGLALFFDSSIEAALIIGGGLALSSTAVVLQVLAERREQNTQVGRLSLAVLLMQDFAVVPLLVLVPLLADRSGAITTILMDAGIKAVVALILIFVAGRLLLRPAFRLIASAKNEDLFTTMTLLIVLGASWATEHAGLSLALGAFMAGLLVAETEYHHQVEADITPFKGILMGLFFMTVGMVVNISYIAEQLVAVVGIAIALIAIKMLLILGLCKLFGFRLGPSLHAGMLLSQGGEFAFILFGLAAEQQLLGEELTQMLLAVVTLTMAATPLLATLGKRIARSYEKDARVTPDHVAKDTYDLDGHVIICGYGRMGKTVAQLLCAEKINFIALDMTPKRVAEGREDNMPVYYGNARRFDVLSSVGVERARAVIVTVNDLNATKKILMNIQRNYPDIPVICRAPDIAQGKLLEEAGAAKVIPETYEASLQAGSALLQTIGTPAAEIIRVVEQFRSRDFSATRAEVAEEKTNRIHEIMHGDDARDAAPTTVKE